MANGAVLADPFRVCADVLVVVTAEASQRVEVTDDVAMREPIDMHLREARVTEDLLQCGHGTVDRRLLRREDGGLIRSVIGGEVVGNGLLWPLGDKAPHPCLIVRRDCTLDPRQFALELGVVAASREMRQPIAGFDRRASGSSSWPQAATKQSCLLPYTAKVAIGESRARIDGIRLGSATRSRP